MKSKATYKLNQSPFFRLQRPKRLAEILHVSLEALESFSKNDERYNCWDEPKKNGTFRRIEAPFDNLKAVQKRISELLMRITPPEYLMAPVKKRSYVDNAAVHVGCKSFHLLDLEDFFPSCTARKVYWFFNTVMQCSSDVAAILTGIATFQGHLPQGGPCSPALAYYAYKDMWEDIHAVVTGGKCNLSVYADDITISGAKILGKDVWRIKQLLRRHGHSHSPQKERSIINGPADITGVIVRGDELLLPNRQHKELTRTIRERQKAKPGRVALTLDRSIRGRRAQASQILGHLKKSQQPIS